MRRIFFTLWFSIVVVASVANAQETAANHWEASIGGGASFPLGDFEEVAETGWLVNPRIGYYTQQHICIGVEYAYYDHAVKDEFLDPFEIPGLEVDAGIAIHQFTGFAKVLFTPNRFAPYAKGHLGAYHSVLNIEIGTLDFSESETKFGLGGGGGIQFRGQGKVGGFVDALYHYIFTDEATTFASVQAGITILFGASR